MNTRKILGLTGAIVVLAVQPGDAAAAGTHSFEGSCAIVGYAELRDSMTAVPTQSWFSYRGEGRCMGTLDGQVMPERGIPVSMGSSGPRTVHSCAVGLDLGVTWHITFDLDPPRRDVTIHGFGDILDVLRVQSSVFHGQRDGTAVALNTIQGHFETLQRCFAEGVTAGSVGIQMDTVTPLVSDDTSGSDGPRAGAGASQGVSRSPDGSTDRSGPPLDPRAERTAGRPQLVVRPRRVRAGKATRVAFRATSPLANGGGPLEGATVRVGGARLRTDARGHASRVVRPRRPGLLGVSMTAPGAPVVASAIRVLRPSSSRPGAPARPGTR